GLGAAGLGQRAGGGSLQGGPQPAGTLAETRVGGGGGAGGGGGNHGGEFLGRTGGSARERTHPPPSTTPWGRGREGMAGGRRRVGCGDRRPSVGELLQGFSARKWQGLRIGHTRLLLSPAWEKFLQTAGVLGEEVAGIVFSYGLEMRIAGAFPVL